MLSKNLRSKSVFGTLLSPSRKAYRFLNILLAAPEAGTNFTMLTSSWLRYSSQPCTNSFRSFSVGTDIPLLCVAAAYSRKYGKPVRKQPNWYSNCSSVIPLPFNWILSCDVIISITFCSVYFCLSFWIQS